MAIERLSEWSVFDERGQRKYLNERERLRFFEHADTQPLRKRVLLYLLAYTGCRISEALQCRDCHLDDTQNIIVLATLKRRKRNYRCIPIPSFLTKMLLRLCGSVDGRLWTIHRVTAWRWVKTAMDYIRVRGPMATCKGLRHGFGIWAATRSVPQNIIQRWMGHAQPTTTAIYLNVVGREERLFAERMWRSEYMRYTAQSN